MTHSPASLPLAADFEAALQKLEILWGLVPRSARPLHKNILEDLGRVFERCIRYTESRAAAPTSTATNGSGGEEEGDETEEPALAIIMRMMRTLSPEQFLQVKILMSMRDLSDEGRFEVFEEIGGSHHLTCGGEIFPGEPHECELDETENPADGARSDGDAEEDADGDDSEEESEGSPAP